MDGPSEKIRMRVIQANLQHNNSASAVLTKVVGKVYRGNILGIDILPLNNYLFQGIKGSKIEDDQ